LVWESALLVSGEKPRNLLRPDTQTREQNCDQKNSHGLRRLNSLRRKS